MKTKKNQSANFYYCLLQNIISNIEILLLVQCLLNLPPKCNELFTGVKVDNKKRKVCFECREEADSCRSRMIDRLRKGEPLVEENFPIPPESTVTLEDSDQVILIGYLDR